VRVIGKCRKCGTCGTVHRIIPNGFVTVCECPIAEERAMNRAGTSFLEAVLWLLVGLLWLLVGLLWLLVRLK
jgi:hypothetical protein